MVEDKEVGPQSPHLWWYQEGKEMWESFFVIAVGILKSNAQCAKQRYHWTRYAKIVA